MVVFSLLQASSMCEEQSTFERSDSTVAVRYTCTMLRRTDLCSSLQAPNSGSLRCLILGGFGCVIWFFRFGMRRALLIFRREYSGPHLRQTNSLVDRQIGERFFVWLFTNELADNGEQQLEQECPSGATRCSVSRLAHSLSPKRHGISWE